MEFPIEIPNCPSCGSEDTIARLAAANEPTIPKGSFASLEKLITPLQDPNKITTPTIKAIVACYDACAKCGTRYLTRAEIVSLPVNIQHRSGHAFPGLGPAR